MKCNRPRGVLRLAACAVAASLVPNAICHAQSEAMRYKAVIDTLSLSRLADLDYNEKYGVLIADSRELTVWQISTDGIVSRMQRPGQGPGEYLSLSAVAWCPDGGFVISDRRSSRINRYGPRFGYESWLSQVSATDVAVDEAGVLYIATTNSTAEGPIVRVDIKGGELHGLTDWRSSADIIRRDNFKLASKALIHWEGDLGILYAVYTIDATIRSFTVRNGGIIEGSSGSSAE